MVILASASFILGVQSVAASATGEGHGSLERTIAFLQHAQNGDGGFGGELGDPSEPDISGWVALALASAGINPQDQARPGGADVFSYLTAHADELLAHPAQQCEPGGCTTSLERELLVVDAAGTSPRDFGGVDLLDEILARQLPGGAFAHLAGGRAGVNDTIFAILALSPVREPRVPVGLAESVKSTIAEAAAWIEREQDADGSWPSTCPKSECQPPLGEVDMTGAALEAIKAAGSEDPEAQTRALSYLKGAQNSDGGFPEQPGPGQSSNTDSTAWAMQGILAAGENPETWTRGESSPESYLESLQMSDGSIALTASENSDSLLNTAYVTPTLSGQTLPYPEVPRAEKPPSPTAAEPAAQAPGVLAGGGGDGAPLFSRPQPQSQGKTRGGARVLASKQRSAAAASALPAGSIHAAAVAEAPPSAPISSNPASDRPPGARARRVPTSGAGTSGTGAGGGTEPEVSGLLLASAHGRKLDATAAAPGLRSSAAESSSALATALAVMIVALALAGSQLERRRPQAVL